MSGDEEAVIRRTDVEAIELNHVACTRIGGEWPEETAVFLGKVREVFSSTGDQMEGGEWEDREITITVRMKAADMGEDVG